MFRDNQKIKHLLYVGSSPPSLGFGSSVIIYRHLNLLKGWRISILTDQKPALCNCSISSDNWMIMETSSRKWWWPPVKKCIPKSLDLRLKLSAIKVLPYLRDNKPDAILTQLGKNSLLALYFSKALETPLSVIVHDRWQVWGKYAGLDVYLNESLAKLILNSASRVWYVSDEMLRYYSGIPDKSSILYPIPEGSDSNFVSWKDSFANSPVIAFAGSYHSPYAPILREAALSLNKINGKLIIITSKRDLIIHEVGEYNNIVYVDSFDRNVQVVDYLKAHASAILIPGSIDKKALGWELSFPSRLVEFSHTGLPLIIASVLGTALSNWAKKNNWLSQVDLENSGELNNTIRAITNKGSWLEMSRQSERIALTEFNPKIIHEQFVRELVI